MPCMVASVYYMCMCVGTKQLLILQPQVVNPSRNAKALNLIAQLCTALSGSLQYISQSCTYMLIVAT